MTKCHWSQVSSSTMDDLISILKSNISIDFVATQLQLGRLKNQHQMSLQKQLSANTFKNSYSVNIVSVLLLLFLLLIDGAVNFEI